MFVVLAYFLVPLLIMFLAKLLLGIGLILIARALLARTPGRAKRALFGVILLIPSCGVYYLSNQNSVHETFQRFRYWRACRRDSELEAPTTPAESSGIRLLRGDGSYDPGGPGWIHDATGNPLYYLGANGGPRFEFVERNGLRYSGRLDDYTVEPMGESRAEYAIDLNEDKYNDLFRFHLSATHQQTGKRIANAVGYRDRASTCPNEHSLRMLLARAIVPRPAPVGRGAERPVNIATAQVIALEPNAPFPDGWMIGEVSGPAKACESLQRPNQTRGGSTLQFTYGDTERSIHLVDPMTKGHLAVIDIACRDGDALVLTRGRRQPGPHLYFLVHYDAGGEMLARYELRADGSMPIDPVGYGERAVIRGRHMQWKAGTVAFEMFAITHDRNKEPPVSIIGIQRVTVTLGPDRAPSVDDVVQE